MAGNNQQMNGPVHHVNPCGPGSADCTSFLKNNNIMHPTPGQITGYNQRDDSKTTTGGKHKWQPPTAGGGGKKADPNAPSAGGAARDRHAKKSPPRSLRRRNVAADVAALMRRDIEQVLARYAI